MHLVRHAVTLESDVFDFFLNSLKCFKILQFILLYLFAYVDISKNIDAILSELRYL